VTMSIGRGIAILGSVVMIATGSLSAAEAPIELEGFNRTYTDLVGELEPYRADPIQVQLRSPSQRLTVRSNRIRAVQGPDGDLVGQLELDIVGRGALVADVDLGGVRQTFSDELILPPQTLVIPGRARLTRVEGGYRVRVEELPERVPVLVQSRLASSVINLCDTAQMLTLGAVSCDGLEEALTRPAVPIPREAGEVYLADAELDATDRAALDRLVAPAP
jgi:hypothetical protein